MEQFYILFGSRTAAETLLFIAAYETGYASRIAETFGNSLNGVQRQLLKFETNGIFVSRTVGRTRVFEFNPRSPLAKSLKEFLLEQMDCLPRDVYKQYFCQRQRPRRTGKGL
ncbi:MAG: ArsR family transcriptional regulator [Coriobacteriia bacterium]|nr:ArsR family transcriptional regulator [Coriobacteriia bacterium]